MLPAQEVPTPMFIFDPERRARPWHVWGDADGSGHVFALCGEVFDARPAGVHVRTLVDLDTICGICLRKQREAAAA